MENHQQQHQLLPDDIFIDILSRLPADSTIRFKRVCKAWRSIIEEDPVFHDMHIRRLISSSDHNNYSNSVSASSATSLGFVILEKVEHCIYTIHNVCFAEYKHDDDDDDHQKLMGFKRWKLPVPKDHPSKIHKNLAIVGSCNGLICLSTILDCDIIESHHTTLVCNPLTGEVVYLSDDELVSSSSLNLVGIGFGYLPSTNEYKVARLYSAEITGFFWERRITHVQVYTLGSSSGGGRWRTINAPRSWSDDALWSLTGYAGPASKLGVSLNGALYFHNCRNVFLFDLANEEFRIIVPTPSNPYIVEYIISELGVMGGCLCATITRSVNDIYVNSRSTITDLWVMMEKEKDNNNNKEDDHEEYYWIKKFTIPPKSRSSKTCGVYGCIPLGSALAPPRILLKPTGKKMIVSYNPETDDDDDSCYCTDIPGNYIVPYVKSCVSLKARSRRRKH